MTPPPDDFGVEHDVPGYPVEFVAAGPCRSQKKAAEPLKVALTVDHPPTGDRVNLVMSVGDARDMQDAVDRAIDMIGRIQSLN